MKKLIPMLLLFVFSMLAMNNVQAGSTKAIANKATVAENAMVKAKPGGYWVAMCVYNPETDTYDFILVWVEDEKSK